MCFCYIIIADIFRLLFIQLFYAKNHCSFVPAEEIPLNPTNSETQTNNQSRLHYDLSVNEAEHQLLNVNSNFDANDSTHLHTSQQNSTSHTKRNGKIVSLLNTQHDFNRPVSNLRDINAMSVASIYDRENNDIMDADK